MTALLEANLDLLRSPRSRLPLARGDGALLTAEDAERRPIVHGLPVLIDPEGAPLGALIAGPGPESPIKRRWRRGIADFVTRLLFLTKRETVENIGLFVETLKQRNSAPLVLVIRGGPRGEQRRSIAIRRSRGFPPTSIVRPTSA